MDGVHKSKKKKRIIVTGGAGAVGSSLANHLTEDPDSTVDVVDNLASGH